MIDIAKGCVLSQSTEKEREGGGGREREGGEGEGEREREREKLCDFRSVAAIAVANRRFQFRDVDRKNCDAIVI